MTLDELKKRYHDIQKEYRTDARYDDAIDRLLAASAYPKPDAV